MLDVSTLYWDPAGPYYIYGRATSELEDTPATRHDGLGPLMLVVPTSFVVMHLPESSAVDAVWEGVAQSTATFEGDQGPLAAAWLRGPGLYRVQAGSETLFIYTMPLPDKWQVFLVKDEEAGRASLPSDMPVNGQAFVEVPSVLELVP